MIFISFNFSNWQPIFKIQMVIASKKQFEAKQLVQLNTKLLESERLTISTILVREQFFSETINLAIVGQR